MILSLLSFDRGNTQRPGSSKKIVSCLCVAVLVCVCVLVDFADLGWERVYIYILYENSFQNVHLFMTACDHPRAIL